MSRSFSPVKKSSHIRILPFGFFTVTMDAPQADLSIDVSTPMSSYRSNSFPTASCIANANGKGFLNTVTTPSISSTCAITLCTMSDDNLKHFWKFSARIILRT
ncbi:conserved hypothetical protein [Trichinella spiralis]|uniref:hypothetical protein n=1 Tax=Trichinella spiralis TaxID=6334 RepID=UPI0001EFE48C|nr:conserved hypothetical protein [Trichinella spiralis]